MEIDDGFEAVDYRYYSDGLETVDHGDYSDGSLLDVFSIGMYISIIG
jgi:hypothetical protein